MTKQLVITAALVFAGACKPDAPAPSAAPATSDSAGRARSAKIDIKPVAPALPADPGSATPDDTAGADDNTPTLPPADDAARKAWRQRREARFDGVDEAKLTPEERKARMDARIGMMRSRFDADGDGKVTPAELAGRGRMRFDDPGALDTNHDGDISTDELSAGLRARREQRRLERQNRGENGAPAPAPTAPAQAEPPTQ